jgi:hypothetical protein
VLPLEQVEVAQKACAIQVRGRPAIGGSLCDRF